VNLEEAKKIIETVLLTSDEPLSVKKVCKVFDENLGSQVVESIIDEIQRDWANRGLELVFTANGWRFRTRKSFTKFVQKVKNDRIGRYPRALMETLAIVAYKQPVTRADIESIRGVTVSSQVIKTLEEKGWIVCKGQREVAGKPMIYGTTEQFLSDLGLNSLQDLPAIESLEPSSSELGLVND
tara:strand:+ start:2072 stop:2620 length:549 start_codon:yes stop_codon:yes gene_type:complete